MSLMRVATMAIGWVIASASMCAQDVYGVVQGVRGKSVTIRIEGAGTVAAGDVVRLSDDVPGVGKVGLKGTWIVKSAAAGSATAEPDAEGAGDPQVGMRATITPAQVRPGVRPLPPSPASPKGKKNRQATLDLLRAIRDDVDGARARALVAAGADVNDADEHGYTMLMKAARSAHLDVLNAILDAGPSIDAQTTDAKSNDEVGHTALMEAVEVGNRRNAAALIERKAKLDLTRRNGDTALLIAVANSDVSTARVLIDAGASLEPANAKGEDALSLARKQKNAQLVLTIEDARRKRGSQALVADPRAGWEIRRPNSGGLFRLQLPPAYRPSAQQFDTIAFLYDTASSPGAPLRVVRVAHVAVYGTTTLDGHRDTRIDELRARFADFSLMESRDAQIVGRAAVGLTYRYTWEGRVVEAVMYIVFKDGRAYEITFAAYADQLEGSKAEFLEILKSFRFE